MKHGHTKERERQLKERIYICLVLTQRTELIVCQNRTWTHLYQFKHNIQHEKIAVQKSLTPYSSLFILHTFYCDCQTRCYWVSSSSRYHELLLPSKTDKWNTLFGTNKQLITIGMHNLYDTVVNWIYYNIEVWLENYETFLDKLTNFNYTELMLLFNFFSEKFWSGQLTGHCPYNLGLVWLTVS